MALSIGPEHLKRYRNIAWLLWRHGRGDWARAARLDKLGDADAQEPEQFARDLESLGPTYVKLGQMLAGRPDLLPPAYLKALERLQDDVAPVPFAQIEQVLLAELDARPTRIFREFNPTPLAAASLAQVHAAELRDGRQVAVKVQRPGAADEVTHDFEAFRAIARVARETAVGRRYQVEDIVREFHEAIEQELDYRLEAENLLALQRILAGMPSIVVPTPYPQFSSDRVLTMERIDGASLAGVSPVVFTEVDGQALAEELLHAYLKQILAAGFFHADPHPGNVLLTRDHRLALIDLGMVGRLDDDIRERLLHLLVAISEGRGVEAADVAARLGTPAADFERDDFRRRVSALVQRNHLARLEQIQAGRIMLEIQQIAGELRLRLPRGMALVGKTLLNLDSVARLLDRRFQPNAAIRARTGAFVRRHMLERLRPGAVLRSSVSLSDLAARLPQRLSDLLDQLAAGGLRLDVDTFDERTFIRGLHKIANRITAGLVVAALIIGAALLARVETSLTFFGYPIFAVILFVLAAVGAAILLFDVLIIDRRDEREHR